MENRIVGGIRLLWGAQGWAQVLPDLFRSCHPVHPMWTEGHTAQEQCTK